MSRYGVDGTDLTEHLEHGGTGARLRCIGASYQVI